MLLVDTGAVELLRRRDRRAEELALRFFPPVICCQVAGEFLFGQVNANVTEAEFLGAAAFLDSFELLHPCFRTAERYAHVRVDLAAKGIKLSDPDNWVAAHALDENFPLLSTDRDFLHIPDVRLFYLPPGSN